MLRISDRAAHELKARLEPTNEEKQAEQRQAYRVQIQGFG